jgi:hypothetical protein
MRSSSKKITATQKTKTAHPRGRATPPAASDRLTKTSDDARPPLDAEYLAMHRIASLYGEDEPELETDAVHAEKRRSSRAASRYPHAVGRGECAQGASH